MKLADALCKLVIRHLAKLVIDTDPMFLRQQAGNDLQILVRLLRADRLDGFNTVRLKVLLKRFDKVFTQLVSRAFRAARITRFELMFDGWHVCAFLSRFFGHEENSANIIWRCDA
ncbi:hypothetical protein [Sphingobium sp. TomTYG75]